MDKISRIPGTEMLLLLWLQTFVITPQVFALEYKDVLIIFPFPFVFAVFNAYVMLKTSSAFFPTRPSIANIYPETMKFISPSLVVMKCVVSILLSGARLIYSQHNSIKSRRVFALELERKAKDREKLANMQGKVEELESEMELQKNM